MSPNTLKIALLCLGLSGLAGCGREEQALPPPPSRPVKVFTVEGGSAEAIRTFPGRVDATQRAELAFRVGGQLQELLVKEGDLVQEGQVLARLDPTDYKIVLEDRQASFDNAARNFERGTTCWSAYEHATGPAESVAYAASPNC